jgi:hypothetical protein
MRSKIVQAIKCMLAMTVTATAINGTNTLTPMTRTIKTRELFPAWEMMSSL